MINLQKGQKINLQKEDGSTLHHVTVGLGWDARKRGLFNKGAEIDCDASAFICQNNRIVSSGDIIYFGNLKHQSNAVKHMGDNLTGAGEGDDEQILVDLDTLPQKYDKIAFVVNIYQARQRRQSFGMIQNAFIRIVDQTTGQEFCRYNLSEDYTGMTAMIFGEIYRHNGQWKFSAMGQGTTDDSVSELARRFQ